MVNSFPHTAILQQTTLNIFCQKIENLYNWMDNLWLKVENILAKGEIALFVQFLLLSLCFSKIRLLQRRQKASIWGKGLRPIRIRQLNYWFINVQVKCRFSIISILADDCWRFCSRRLLKTVFQMKEIAKKRAIFTNLVTLFSTHFNN